MPTNDARFNLPKPVGADPVSQLRLTDTAVIDFLRDQGVVGARGALADRPAANTAHAGKRVWVASDQGNRVDLDIGTGWITINDVPDGSVTAAKLDAAAVVEAKYAPNSIPAVAFKDATIGALELVAALKPSEGASGATEALRALGTGAGQAMAGNTPLAKSFNTWLSFTRGEDDAWPAAGKKVGSFRVRKQAGQTVTLTTAEHMFDSGSGTTFTVYKNGVALTGSWGGIAPSATEGQTNPTDEVLADGDRITVHVVAAGTGKGGYLELVLLHTV